MSRTVKIACLIPNGIYVRLYKSGFDDGTGDGVKPTVHDGPAVRLNGPSPLHTGVGNTDPVDIEPGFTEVDAEWWEKWVEQNAINPAVATKQIFVAPEDEPNPTR